MHGLKGKKQTKEHIAKRVAASKGKTWTPKSGRPRNTEKVLWSKVDKHEPDECWPWIGSTNGGYGRTEIRDRAYYAHRMIYYMTHPGEITLEGPEDVTSGGLVLHICNNKLCCNPLHLYVGTQKDNMRDRLKTGDGYRNQPRGDANWKRRNMKSPT